MVGRTVTFAWRPRPITADETGPSRRDAGAAYLAGVVLVPPDALGVLGDKDAHSPWPSASPIAPRVVA